MAKSKRTNKPAFPHFAREYACGTKERFPTREEAEQALSKKGPSFAGCRVYRCPWCPEFHLGHASNKWKRKIVPKVSI